MMEEDDNGDLLELDGSAAASIPRDDSRADSDVEVTRSVKIFALCASLNACTVGYDQGAATHIGKLIQENLGLSDLERGMFIATLFSFMIVGAVGSPFISDRVGRRAAMACSSYVFLIGAVMMLSLIHI